MSRSADRDARRNSQVCWLSSARYSQPLDSTSARKWQLLAGLPGYEIRVIGFATSSRARHFHEQVDFYLLPQLPLSLLRYLTFFVMAPLLLGWLTMRRRADIIVAQSPFEGAVGAWVKLLGRLIGRTPRLIIENHNNFEVDLFLQRRVPLPGAYRAMMMAFARLAFRHADATRVVSSTTAERCRAFAPQLPQVRFMTWSDTDVFRHTPRQMPAEQAVDIVYAGVLRPGKGVHHLLDAFARLDHPQARLQLVGAPANADYAAALHRQAQELGISQRVQFVGAVSQSRLAGYFAAARVMVLPSLSEGLPRVIVEAMMTGTPVIGTRISGIPDIIQDGENSLLISPDDADDLLRALRQIYALDVAVMAAKARSFALDFFSPDKYAAGYQQLFETALRRPATATATSAEPGKPGAIDNKSVSE